MYGACLLVNNMSGSVENEDTLAAALCSTRDDIKKVLETARLRFEGKNLVTLIATISEPPQTGCRV